MADTSLLPDFDHSSAERFTSNMHSTRLNNTWSPPPNPPFVFPMQSPLPQETGDDSVHGSTPKRPRPYRIAVTPLPPFDFNPSSAGSMEPTRDTPTESPTKSIPISGRAGGHRRGGSEFIGGDGTGGGPGLMNTSPTTGDGVLPSPTVSPRGPLGSRHAHRRSGAVSSHDISSILKPSSEAGGARSGSAPVTPSVLPCYPQFSSGLDKSASQPALLPAISPDATPSSSPEDTISNQAVPRPRVGFSDTVEFIPRPLSTISSETSSSLSTARAHSVADSITSIVSNNSPSSPAGNRDSVLYRALSRPSSRQAQSWSEAVNTGYLQSDGLQDEDDPVSDRPSSADTSSMFSSQDVFVAPAYHCGTPGLSDYADQAYQQITALGATSSSSIGEPREPSAGQKRPMSSPGPSPSGDKRQQKVKSWAESIWPKRGKQSTAVADSTTLDPWSPPQNNLGSNNENLLDAVIIDNDSAVIFRNQSQQSESMLPRTDFSNWKPRKPVVRNDDRFYDSDGVFDLDAFGILGDSERTSAVEQASVDRFSAAKLRMHSAGMTGGFFGPGMHYRRRAESAPQMVSVDHHGLGFPRLGSNSSMADVFEEDEEDEHSNPDSRDAPSCRADGLDNKIPHGLGVPVAKSAFGEEGSEVRRREADEVPLEEPISGDLGTTMPITETIKHDAMAVDIVDASEEPRFSVVTKSSDESTVTPTLLHDASTRPPLSSAIDYSYPGLAHPFNSPETTSSVSSPDFTDTSFDVPRLNTATSSITDRTTWSSSRLGEISQDLCMSTEDIPSLTSCASTMMSAHPGRMSSSAGTRSSVERSTSFSAAVPARTQPENASKRGSLASITDLVRGSHREKSKLSIESRAMQEEMDKGAKKKGNRMSRFMRFLKPKDRVDP